MAAEGQRELFLEPDADLHHFIAADMIQGSARASPTKQSIVAGLQIAGRKLTLNRPLNMLLGGKTVSMEFLIVLL